MARLLAGVGATLPGAPIATGPVATTIVTASILVEQRSGLCHLALHGGAQRLGADDDASRDERQQQGILDRRDAALVGS